MKRNDVFGRLRPILLARRASLLQSLNSDLSVLCQHDEPHEEEILSRLSVSESRELEAIDEALQRLREGRYGTCEKCGRNISLERLRAVPFISTCIECQRLTECNSPHHARQPAFA
jgi:DnaK suppressor protein